MLACSIRNLSLFTLCFLFSTRAERDFNFNDDIQISLVEPQEEPSKILVYKNPYTIEYSQCPYTESKIMLSLVLKSKDWKDLIEKKRTKVLNKLSKFFAIPKEFIDFDSVTKRELLDLSKNSIRRGPNKSDTSKRLGRVDLTIGCGETYFAAGEPISNQIALQMKDGSIDDITGVDFGWWVIWRKKLSNRVQRYRRQLEGSGEEEYEYEYEDEDGDDDLEESVTEIPQVTTHAHRHHHGLAKPEITDTSKIKKIPLDTNIIETTNKNKHKKNNVKPLVKNENIDEDIVRGVSKLESDITKTIENTKRIKDLPPFVDSEINSSPLQEDIEEILKNNDDFVIDDFDTTTPLTVGVVTTSLPVSSRNSSSISSSSSRSSTTAKVIKSTTISVEKPASVTPIMFEQTTLLSTTPTALLPKQPYDDDSSTLVPLITDEVVTNSVNTIQMTNTSTPSATTTTATESSFVATTPVAHALTPIILVTTTTIPFTSSSPSVTTITPAGVTEQSEPTTPTTSTSVVTSTTVSTTGSVIVLSKKNDTSAPPLIDEELTSILPIFEENEDSENLTTPRETEASMVPTTTTQLPTTTTTESTTTSTTTPATASITTTTTTTTTSTTTTTTTTPKPTTTPAITTTEYIEPDHINVPPMIKTRLKKHPVTAGKPFSLTVPLETFYDNEDGTNLRLDLLDKNGNELKSTSWIQFNAETREIYGLPLEDAVSKWQYKLSATDSSNETVVETLDITVQQYKGDRSANHEISIGVRLNEKYVRNIDWQIALIEGIVNSLGDDSMFAVVVREIRQSQLDPNTATFVYKNETLPKTECPDEELNELVKLLNEKLSKFAEPQLTIKTVTGQTIGPCQKHNVPKPKPTSHMAKNYPPVPRNQVDRVNATVGHLLVYKVPADTFYDPNDTTDLKLSLLTNDRKEIGGRHWLQFDTKNQEFYGIPKSVDMGSEEYLLVAEDSGGLQATDALVVVVSHAPKREFSVSFKAYIGIHHDQFHADLQRKFVERVTQLFGDHTTQFIQIRSFNKDHDSGGTIVSFFNTTLYKSHNRCPEEEIEAVRSVYFHQDTQLRDRVKKIIGNEFNLTNVQVIPLGSCNLVPEVIHHETVPTKTEEPNPTSTFTDDYLFTFILPAVIIVVMILLASVIACVLHRRRLTGKMELGDEEERKSFRSKGIPVIFQDELDEKPEIGNKSPIIFKDEKPPLLPPYNSTNLDGDNDVDEYVPPPAVVVGGRELRGKSPVTPSYRKPPPYVSP